MRYVVVLCGLVLAASAAWAQQKDCSKVPEAYRATCEAAMAKKSAVDKDCGGLEGDALKNCVAQKNPGGGALPAGSSPGAQAREACRSQYTVNDTAAFERCMREEMAKRR